MANNFFLDNEDLRFNIENQDWHELYNLLETDKNDEEAPKNVEEAKVLYHEFLRSLGEYIAEKIYPEVHKLDEEHPKLEGGEMYDPPTMRKFIQGLADMGAMAMPFPRYLNGFNLPWVIANAACEMMARADVSVMTYYGFFSGIGMALKFLSIEEGSFEAQKGTIVKTRFDDAIKDLASGKTCGAMCLTEPQAGSDLSNIRTKAVKNKDGSYAITGEKIWITCGHGEHHLVLAKTEAKKSSLGLKALSLFYVPAHIIKDGKQVRNFSINGQEKKMGQHSSVTASLSYDNSTGYLIGKSGHGFRGMSLLMNDARLLVGYEGIGLCENVLRKAKDYAQQRESMGKKLIEHEMIADYIDDMELDNIALRSMAYYSSFMEEMSNRLKCHIKINEKRLPKEELEALEEKLKHHKWQARITTPLVKYVASENAVNFARMGIQIFGGNGYMQEYGMEKLMRDALVLPIYEGTSQIQALMVLKDHLQYAMRNPGKFLSKIAQTKLSFAGKSGALKDLSRIDGIYYSAMQTLLTRIIADKFGDIKDQPLTFWKEAFLRTWDPKKDFSFGLLNAERFCLIASRRWMAKILVKQALKISDDKIKQKRLDLAQRFMHRAESKMQGWLGEIQSSKSTSFRKTFLPKNCDQLGNSDIK